jgi:hypothetical protein
MLNRSKKVRTNKVRQNNAGTGVHKEGKPYRGANLVQQKDESAKKAAHRQTVTRKKAAK